MKLLKGILILILFTLIVPKLYAQNYSFKVPKNISKITILKDGSIDIDYEIEFSCDEYAHCIDIIDVGLPNKHYDLSTARAWLNDNEVYSIYKSEYIDIGVEIHLSGETIYDGQSGTLKFHINNPNMIYQDRDDPDYAGLQFSPTWYGSEFTSGFTNLEVHFVFPEGVSEDETRYHKTKFDDWYKDEQERIVFVYKDKHAFPSKQYMYGVSFPKKYVDKIHKEPSAFIKGFYAIWNVISNPVFLIFFFIAGGIIGIVALVIWSEGKRNMQYLPPLLSIEGVGVRKGLKAPEAALLLKHPLNEVLSSILFGLMKKGAVLIRSDAPLVLEKTIDVQKFKAYERDFLEAIKKDGTLNERKLHTAIVDMIKGLKKKLKGHSHKDTIKYYDALITQAWSQVEAADTPEVKMKDFDDNFLWMLLDKNYDNKFKDTFITSDTTEETYYYAPNWYYTSGMYSNTEATSGSNISIPSGMNYPKIPGSKFANVIVNKVETWTGNVVEKVSKFTTGVTKITNPPPVYTSSSTGGSSGSSCACACACASCACACAGGGR